MFYEVTSQNSKWVHIIPKTHQDRRCMMSTPTTVGLSNTLGNHIIITWVPPDDDGANTDDKFWMTRIQTGNDFTFASENYINQYLASYICTGDPDNITAVSSSSLINLQYTETDEYDNHWYQLILGNQNIIRCGEITGNSTYNVLTQESTIGMSGNSDEYLFKIIYS